MMGWNTTTHRSDGEADSGIEQIISDYDILQIMRIFMYYVTPTVSLFGVLGNVSSLIILAKHGLGRCSNILLFCLAVSDLSFLVAFNSPPKIIYEVSRSVPGFLYSEPVSRVLFVLYSITNVLDYGMSFISFTLPMLITFERLVAVFLPLKFHQIVTPTRTWCAVLCVTIFWISFISYSAFWSELVFMNDSTLNYSLGVIQRSTLYNNDPEGANAIENSYINVAVNLSACFTLIGCVFISVKIKVMASKRKRLTAAASKESTSSNRTTKMLLAVCAVYTVTCVAVNLPNYIPQYFYFTISSDAPSNLGRLMYQVMNLVICINGSCNFIVYVGMNKNYREIYKSLFVRCRPNRKKWNQRNV